MWMQHNRGWKSFLENTVRNSGTFIGIRDLTATREVGFAKLLDTGLGKERSIQDSDDRTVRDTGFSC